MKIENDKLYIPIKTINKKNLLMRENHGKIRSYQSTETLNMYAPDCNYIAIFTLTQIVKKGDLKK